jgi:hypothetical protein
VKPKAFINRKSAGRWLVTREAMGAHYGKRPDKEQIDRTPVRELDNEKRLNTPLSGKLIDL